MPCYKNSNNTHIRSHILSIAAKESLDLVSLKHSHNFFGKYQQVLDQMILESFDK